MDAVRARRRRGRRPQRAAGFPANDFAGQEPRSNDEIAKFCEANYGVTFPMFAGTAVTGEDANPLFRRLGAAVGRRSGTSTSISSIGAGGSSHGSERARSPMPRSS